MTGAELEESGPLCYPIVLTNTHQVGTAHEAVVAYGREKGHTCLPSLAVVAETWDGWPNDIAGFHVQRGHVFEALESARPGPVAEGNVGGGTGMLCHDFKGGIGTASRLVSCPSGEFTVGALVQANHGDRKDFRVDGVPAGLELDETHTPSPWCNRQPRPG